VWGFTPLSRCTTWDGAVEVTAALLSPASSDDTVRHGEHFAIAARALLAPLFHAAALSGGGGRIVLADGLAARCSPSPRRSSARTAR
jgi:hypothetical protein